MFVRKGQGRGEYTTHTSSFPLGPREIIFLDFPNCYKEQEQEHLLLNEKIIIRERERERDSERVCV